MSYYWVLPSSIKFDWVYLGLLGFTGFLLGFYWVLLDLTGFGIT